MEQVPVGTEHRLSEFLFRNFNTVLLQLNQCIADIVSLKNRVTALENKSRGGMRKITNQTIGTLGAAWVNITNYDSNTFSVLEGVNINLVTGTLSPTIAGDYNLICDFEYTCDATNNKGENFDVQLYNVTDAVVVSNVQVRVWQGAYQGGGSIGSVMPFTLASSALNKQFLLRISSASSIATFVVTQVGFTLEQL
jgi:hypothetical protein